ncbi:TFIIB-type zinc ribbon-containing protein [Herbaspirillum seropedicae]|uniref:TFIIB-type zinc ribbon-containing protein n=1 Tax=Herbaspirillum seropedicae TaxID=964 RepID=UPI003FCD5794
MKCPVCTSQHLLISERQGIEIDYCPQCRGVWLDRGELDKLIERSATAPAAPAQRPPAPAQDMRFGHGAGHAGYERREHHGQSHHHGGYGYDAKRKKKGFLGEIFDFD